MQHLEITNVDDARNGVLMFKPIERAFDHGQLYFAYDISTHQYKLHVLDADLLDKKLLDMPNRRTPQVRCHYQPPYDHL
jgi:HNH endonuclease